MNNILCFCEDCGKKNILNPTPLQNKKAEFRCSSCNYLNAYPLNLQERVYLKKADLFFKEIVDASEIMGSFLYHIKKGVLKNNMPKLLKKNDLNILGAILIKSYQLCISQYKDVNEMTLVISDKNMVAKQISSELFIILSCKTRPLSQSIYNKLTHLVSDNK
ncbi:MAG: hypothetical protein GY699_11770 [Desulfobacteraceae bacterium]|nr:hypothetical protein [Desulfobacteraceae bacterium]